MALPASPPISITQIQTEMGAPAGTSLTALVRGGTYTPSTPANAGVPTAPPIDVLDFLGASGARVQITSRSLTSSQVVPPSATATRQYRVAADGFIKTSSNGSAFSNLEQWLLGGSNADYQIRMTNTSGTVFTGPANATWHDMTSDLTWSVSRTGVGFGVVTGTATAEIRNKVSGVVLATATITLTAETTT